METLKHITNKHDLVLGTNSKIEIPNVTRDILTKWAHELGFKIGVEVGVAGGIFSRVICETNPQMKVYGVDPWESYSDYEVGGTPEEFAKYEHRARKRLASYTNYEILKEYSVTALQKFEDNSVDFVYIDANHREPFISEDVNGWYKKVKIGGILSGHDYVRLKKGYCDVRSAVHTFVTKNNINPWFVLGAEEKTPGLARDDIRSWAIIKQ